MPASGCRCVACPCPQGPHILCPPRVTHSLSPPGKSGPHVGRPNGRGNGAAASCGTTGLSMPVLGRLSQGDGKLEAFLDYIISLCHINQNKKREWSNEALISLISSVGVCAFSFPPPTRLQCLVAVTAWTVQNRVQHRIGVRPWPKIHKVIHI